MGLGRLTWACNEAGRGFPTEFTTMPLPSLISERFVKKQSDLNMLVLVDADTSVEC